MLVECYVINNYSKWIYKACNRGYILLTMASLAESHISPWCWPSAWHMSHSSRESRWNCLLGIVHGYKTAKVMTVWHVSVVLYIFNPFNSLCQRPSSVIKVNAHAAPVWCSLISLWLHDHLSFYLVHVYLMNSIYNGSKMDGTSVIWNTKYTGSVRIFGTCVVFPQRLLARCCTLH